MSRDITLADLRASSALQQNIDSEIGSLDHTKGDKGNDQMLRNINIMAGEVQLMFWFLTRWFDDLNTFLGCQ